MTSTEAKTNLLAAARNLNKLVEEGAAPEAVELAEKALIEAANASVAARPKGKVEYLTRVEPEPTPESPYDKKYLIGDRYYSWEKLQSE